VDDDTRLGLMVKLEYLIVGLLLALFSINAYLTMESVKTSNKLMLVAENLDVKTGYRKSVMEQLERIEKILEARDN